MESREHLEYGSQGPFAAQAMSGVSNMACRPWSLYPEVHFRVPGRHYCTHMGLVWVQLHVQSISPQSQQIHATVLPKIPSVTHIGPGNVVVIDTVSRPLIAMAATRAIELQRWVIRVLRLGYDASFR